MAVTIKNMRHQPYNLYIKGKSVRIGAKETTPVAEFTTQLKRMEERGDVVRLNRADKGPAGKEPKKSGKEK